MCVGVGRGEGCLERAHPGPIFNIFVQFLGKIDQNNRLVATTLELVPPQGNPGSTTS